MTVAPAGSHLQAQKASEEMRGRSPQAANMSGPGPNARSWLHDVIRWNADASPGLAWPQVDIWDALEDS